MFLTSISWFFGIRGAVLEQVSLEQMIETTKERYQEALQPCCDLEICLSVQRIVSFARGEGLWGQLSVTDRC